MLAVWLRLRASNELNWSFRSKNRSCFHFGCGLGLESLGIPVDFN